MEKLWVVKFLGFGVPVLRILSWNGVGALRLVVDDGSAALDKNRHTKGLPKEKEPHRERENIQKGGKQ